MLCSLINIDTADCLAISFKTVAKPPRVGSRITWISGQAFSKALVSARNGLTSLSILPRKDISPRASNTAAPCCPTVPETIMASPGLAILALILRPGGIFPMPAVLIYSPSALPFSTTLVSPATTCTPDSSAASFIESTTSCRRLVSKPSSMINPADRKAGTAPATHKSLTVPQTARRPMSPPGKNSGLTTKESVVKHQSQ